MQGLIIKETTHYRGAGAIAELSLPATNLRMPATRRHRSKPPGRRRALELLAGCGDAGCPAGTLAASGFGIADMMALVREGLASPNAEPLGMYDLSWLRITDAGRRALETARR